MKHLLILILFSIFVVSCDESGTGGSLVFGGMCNLPINKFCVEYDEDLTTGEAETACDGQAGRIIAETPVFLPGSINKCSVTSEVGRCIVADSDYVIIYDTGGIWDNSSAAVDCALFSGNYVPN